MSNGRKLLLLSASLLVLHSTSSCTSLYQQLGWEDRTLPDGDTVNFQNRHVPPLNPSDPTNGLMHVPVGNEGQINQTNEPAGDTTSPTSMAVPVVPVTTVATDTPAANNSAYPALTSVPPAPTVPGRDVIKSNYSSLENQQQSSESARSGLMSDANATVMTSPQTGQLVANPTEAMPAGTAPAPTSPTSMAPAASVSAAAPQPAGTAVASNGNSDSGFNSWLHNLKNLFSSNKPTTTADASAMKSPVENPPMNPNGYSPATPALASNAPVTSTLPPAPSVPAPMVVSSVPPAAMPSPEPYPAVSQNAAPVLHYPGTMPAPAPAAAATAQANTPLPPLPPLDTSFPASQTGPISVNSNSLPDISQLTKQDDQPVTLVQPVGSAPSGDEYIDSRYPQND